MECGAPSATAINRLPGAKLRLAIELCPQCLALDEGHDMELDAKAARDSAVESLGEVGHDYFTEAEVDSRVSPLFDVMVNRSAPGVIGTSSKS